MTRIRSRVRVVCLLALTLTFFAVTPASAQLSPGPLSRPHRQLDGPTQCTKCHEFGVATPRFKCTECHSEIRVRLEAGRGYHAKIAKLSEEGRDCVGCHMEHFGPDFEILYFGEAREKFAHAETGYPLQGKHAAAPCSKCHNAEHVPQQELKVIQIKDPKRTFLGLSQACTSCHADPHRGELGAECSRCHGFDAWKERGGFDHAQTRFPLTGKHAEVACTKCHTARVEGESTPRYTGINGERCESCHRDPHGGAFSQRCESCHTTGAWITPSLSTKFDHSTTDYALEGKHAAVSCRKCHPGVDFHKPLAHGRCMDCHQDIHQGQFLARVDGGDCKSCHNLEAFVPATFGVREHQRSAYSLEGRHLRLECGKCHKPVGRQTRYRVPFQSCEDCHKDPHEGEFREAKTYGRCQQCHTVDGFQPSTFTADRHSETRLPLEGSHVAVACVDCHHGMTEPAPMKFTHRDLTCTGCHEDPHRGQFAARLSNGGEPLQCSTCHSERSWKRLREFDHDRTSFKLASAHRKVGCLECHRPDDRAAGISAVVFHEAATECAGCHEDIHAGQFDRGGTRYACTTCHNNTTWEPTRFDHELYSTFSLKGAHESVSCRQCHLKTESLAGAELTIYRGTPRDCAGCHSAEQRP